MFLSNQGVTVEVTIDFPSEEDRRRKKKDQKEDTEEKKSDSKLAKLYIKKLPPPQDNFIKDNINNLYSKLKVTIITVNDYECILSIF